jgi:hypothetical protein
VERNALKENNMDNKKPIDLSVELLTVVKDFISANGDSMETTVHVMAAMEIAMFNIAQEFLKDEVIVRDYADEVKSRMIDFSVDYDRKLKAGNIIRLD